jgi:hypothetical protein
MPLGMVVKVFLVKGIKAGHLGRATVKRSALEAAVLGRLD